MKEKVINTDLDKNQAIKVEHLFAIYNENNENQVVSLCDNNLVLEKNKIHFIIGNSGCGKSTLVNHFNGLLKAKYGNVYVQNKFKVGNDYYIDKLFIASIDHKTIPNFNLEISNNMVICAFNNRCPKHIVEILFKAYYKLKAIKIKFLANFSKDNFFLYLITFDDSINILNIKDKIDYKNIEKNLSNETLIKRYFFKKRWLSRKKIKRIKNLKKTVGIVFQFPEYQLFKDTVLNDVMFGPINLGMPKEEAREKSIKYLKMLRINEQLFNNSPFSLSGGQKRRVAISGILAFDPEILVFDEPTAGLDPAGEKEILNIIEQAKKFGKTIIVISHNMDHVLEIADNVVLMNEGEIIKTGSPYEIFTDNKLLDELQINPPMIISTINKMVKIDKKFSEIFTYQPRDIASLSHAISKVVKI
ncbi:MAG: ATP-binding cassette domain-containing protein [Ureaplasma sp.]|nr:ATP-binding cassette domain-containing protein [Ureaplasma sp.]